MRTKELQARIARFQDNLPYTSAEYASRSWGHNLHSLCSYQGKLKPSLAHWLVQSFTDRGSRVLDPIAGVGTVPFEAALNGRLTVANDLSPLAAVVAAAKVAPPALEQALEDVRWLEQRMADVEINDDDYKSATFGLNATVADYYHPDTLVEVLKARRIMKEDGWDSRPFLWASALHVLHGNRPYALSRTSHPITPFSPKGEFEYRSLIDRVTRRINAALAVPLPSQFRPGSAHHGDFRDLASKIETTFDAIITSPPFLGMRFDRPNWLRLWFCGWGQEDFNTRSLGFLERQQTRSRNCYEDFFAVSRKLINDDGLLVMHLGSGSGNTGRHDMVGDLKGLATGWFHLAGEVIEDVAHLEAHGLTDKGRRTTKHHLLFFTPGG
ncbi:TRM11 family methyltransferase [Micromonospora sp. AKA38]|uniref:hypothetical protein n=1 Tax=Micromonospora sp. AKA38 TaxID=2733861 RepID=UPI0022BC7144|nr:hypothetical protein [Micromonospora sp. AKA38]GHJ12701.1 hypothetical protein TPA0908_06960 [Micromonospora sp. AKA38]